MVGLDAAGETTMRYKLKLDEVATTILLTGINVETVEYKNSCFAACGTWTARDKIWPMWEPKLPGSRRSGPCRRQQRSNEDETRDAAVQVFCR